MKTHPASLTIDEEVEEKTSAAAKLLTDEVLMERQETEEESEFNSQHVEKGLVLTN